MIIMSRLVHLPMRKMMVIQHHGQIFSVIFSFQSYCIWELSTSFHLVAFVNGGGPLHSQKVNDHPSSFYVGPNPENLSS
ncbi:hypothetical protein QVD17_20300 [Tagetes erecta]|uniref:Uncharacterized protein n=1 Tax=Tagetes erecta TaxID=13708 RepID=A0AAD8KNX0_TARER|nr:hypothetical protein QVD17_20300 [Tagetes erecta]